MRVLFVHNNFPGQFLQLAPALAALPGNEVVALCMRSDLPANWRGVRVASCRTTRGSSAHIHPWVSDLETKTIRAEAAWQAALALRAGGFLPDIIIAHPGWGESLFLKQVWPNAKLGLYSEYYYHATGADVGFDPAFPAPQAGDDCRMFMRNANYLLHFAQAEAAIAPTRWQAGLFPAACQSRISVIHDGIDTRQMAPRADASMSIGDGIKLTRHDEVVTFFSRNLEPYRGYHVFMRALPELLRRRPNAHILVVGGEGAGYGMAPPAGTSWKEIYAREAMQQITAAQWQRVHFLGVLPHEQLLALMQLTSVHVYLTYPFVLSWSVLEAMSAGCAIVGSATGPVQDVIEHGRTGRLVDFFDAAALVEQVCDLLDAPDERTRLGGHARAFVQEHFDLTSVCLPRQLAWVRQLAGQ